MNDPRIEELMEYEDTVDENGGPTSMALIARRVGSHVEVIDELREQVTKLHSDVETLEARADNLSEQVEGQRARHDELVEAAQVAASRASAAVNTGHGARLRKDAAEKKQVLDQFELEFGDAEKRLNETLRALQSRRQRLIETRDQIARRVNTIDALVKRAEIEWPEYTLDENKRLKGGSGTPSRQPTVRRRRGSGSGRRRIVRRRKAS